MRDALPPSYVNSPVPIAYARVDDALIVTMIRILGLCWAYDCERTPALPPDRPGSRAWCREGGRGSREGVPSTRIADRRIIRPNRPRAKERRETLASIAS